MQTQMWETHLRQNEKRMALERVFWSLDQELGHPAEDTEICDAMSITLEKFDLMLDQIKELRLGGFEKMAIRNGVGENEPLIQYIPDLSQTELSFVLPESKIREALTTAIEKLPKLEQVLMSLLYYEGLTVQDIERVLEMDRARIIRLHTKAMLRLRSRLNYQSLR
jgi:RNA polymerase sigma factor FliA